MVKLITYLFLSSEVDTNFSGVGSGASMKNKHRPLPSVSLKDPKKLMVLITQMGHPVTGIPLDLNRVGVRSVEIDYT